MKTVIFGLLLMHVSVVFVHGQECAKPFDQQFWKFQNMLRTDPKAFVPYLEDWLTRFSGDDNKTYTTKKGQEILTNEGKPAVQELIDFLKVQPALHPLQWSDPLYRAALNLATIQGPTGQTGHTGPFGSTMASRIDSEMLWEIAIGENLMYGGETPLEALLKLAIDDGVPGRGHRRNIFKSQYYFTGIATEMHNITQSETVSTFSGAIKPDADYEAPTIKVPKTADEYTKYATWDTPSTCVDYDPYEDVKRNTSQAEDEMKCDLKIAVFTDDKCHDAPDDNEGIFNTNEACMPFNQTRDIWFFDLNKLIDKIQDNLPEQDDGTEQNGNTTLPFDLNSIQAQDATIRFFPRFVKHSCSDDKYVVDFFTDPDCRINLEMQQAIKKGNCNYIDLGDDKQFFSVSTANALKITVSAVIALFASYY